MPTFITNVTNMSRQYFHRFGFFNGLLGADRAKKIFAELLMSACGPSNCTWRRGSAEPWWPRRWASASPRWINGSDDITSRVRKDSRIADQDPEEPGSLLRSVTRSSN
jgi:hypothetical protein